MPGERLAKITIQIALSHNDNVRGTQTTRWSFTVGNQLLEYRRGGQPGEFIVPDPDEAGVGESYGLRTVQNVLNLLAGNLFASGAPYQVSTPRQVGTLAGYYDSSPQAPVIEFSITATNYDNNAQLGFQSNYSDPYFPNAFTITEQVSNISPVFARATVQNATYYGGADGEITVTATGGSYAGPNDSGAYFFVWSDIGAGPAHRTNLRAGNYTCEVHDLSSPAFTTVAVTVRSDERLDVQVQQIGNDVHLVISGGLPPYIIQWADGPTTADRLGLASGTYACTVTDARGVQVTVTVVISTLNTFYFSRNPITLELQATDLATKPGLRFQCEVFVEPAYLSGDFVQVGTVLEQPADSLGATVFDVSTLLDAYVQPDFPVHGETGVARADLAFRRFYLQHSEQWTGGGAPAYTVRQTHYLVYGGLDFFEYASQSYFKVYRAHVHPFMSWEPVQKTVFYDQPEYLTYHHDSLSDDTFTVLVKFVTANGASSSQVLASRTGVQCFELWRLGVGLPQLQAVLGNQVPADVVAWEVSVQDATGAAATETRYYQLSDELPVNRRYFLYANSVGGINTLAAYGKGKLDLSFSSVLVQRSLQPNYLADQGETYTASAAGLPVLTCNTGHLSLEQREALQDFLLSEEIRFFDADRYRPGSLQPADSVALDDDDAGLLQVEFAFVLPTRRRYTPTLPLRY